MAAESERSPYRNGTSGGSRRAQKDEAATSTSRRSTSEGDMIEVPRSTFNSQVQASLASQMPKLTPAVPGLSAPASSTNSAISSRESSPVRSAHRPRNSASNSRLSSRSHRASAGRSPSRSSFVKRSGSDTLPSATAVQRILSQTNKPLIINPPSNAEPSTDASSPEKPNMPLWATSGRAEQEPTLPNISSKRSLLSDDSKSDRSAPRSVNRSINAPVSALETVQEMASDQSTPSTETILNQPALEQSRLQNIEEDSTPKASRQNAESGSDSGGNKSLELMEENNRRRGSGAKGPDTLIPKRSSTSLGGARGKPTDGSVRNMIVETETVTSIPQVSLGVVTGDRSNSGRVDPSTLRMKPSTETIRPKKEKKRTRKPTTLSSGAASSKADIFEAKVASAVDEADVSDSDETFVYESNPPDPYPVRQNRYHSRTPSATSMASQVDQLGTRGRPGMRDGNHSVTGKRSMKFTNNTYAGSVDGDAAEDSARSHSRVDGGGAHTPRHHHIGRYGRNNAYPSLFDSDSPFPQSQAYPKSPRHFIGGFRQSRHSGARGGPNYRTINNTRKAGEIYGYDFDAEGADDERTPLVGSPRLTRSRHGNRRPGSASLRQMEYMQQRQRSCFTQYGACVVISLLLLVVIGGATSFIVGITKSLVNVQILAIQNVLASEQEIMLDLNVSAINPNLFPVAIDDMDMNIFARSRFVGTDKLWRDHGSDLSNFPRVEDSRKRARLASLARCAGSSGCLTNATTISEHVLRTDGGVDKGTDPIPTDPAGDPQTMLLGRVFRFDSPLTFEASPWNYMPSTSKGQIRLARPGNKTEEGGTERWERVLQHPFELIVRGVVKYQLPLSSRFLSASVSSSVKVVPDGGDNGAGDNDDGDDGDKPMPGANDTVTISKTRSHRRSLLESRQVAPSRSTLESIREALRMTGQLFTA
ncbi:putative phospholipid metabolism enzyme regulator [Aspergillus alliaceus]|uniref:putative phospholipid metabolism enzyme regulator n=1 Tax=Petromyces alliaceus TaxID=209559 RepID=UPI0012A3B821|nr:vacuolar segregation subunit 7-domain-containing protein [Aspergillus alliaceus]KAB8231729.1 vacuolar segregation subunit 7-domain-containing protein [Aspergillus alliaceus]